MRSGKGWKEKRNVCACPLCCVCACVARPEQRESNQGHAERRGPEEEGWGGGAGCPGVPMVLPCKPGVHEWWESCMRESLVGMGGLDEEELRRLKPKERMVKCMSRTQTLGNIF